MTSINPQFVAQVEKITAALDNLDYFQLLRLPYEATDEQIRAGYHSQARTFHPDRYNYLDAPDLVRDLGVIAKRITEAYVILRDADKRAQYLTRVQGERRAQHLRYRESHEVEQRERESAKGGTTRQGRQMYDQAVAAYESGDRATAIQNLKMALLYEKDNSSFKELLDEWTEEG